VPLLINPFSSQPVEAAKGLFFEGLALVMLAGLAVTRLTHGDIQRRQASGFLSKARLRTHLLIERPYFLPALAYLLVCFAATLRATDPWQSFLGNESRRGLLLIASLVIFFLVSAEIVQSVEQAEWLVTAILTGSVAVAIYGFLQYFGLDPLTWSTDSLSPVHSTTGYSLYLGAYLAMGLVYLAAFIRPRLVVYSATTFASSIMRHPGARRTARGRRWC